MALTELERNILEHKILSIVGRKGREFDELRDMLLASEPELKAILATYKDEVIAYRQARRVVVQAEADEIDDELTKLNGRDNASRTN